MNKLKAFLSCMVLGVFLMGTTACVVYKQRPAPRRPVHRPRRPPPRKPRSFSNQQYVIIPEEQKAE